MRPGELTDDLRKGDPRALAKLISYVEDRQHDYPLLLDEIYPRTGGAFRLGITGPPGAGKSTLIDKLVPLFRKEDRQVGLLVCDPTSPFSGGALLGDRIRLRSLRDDEGVFIRSLATRGSLGGLATMAYEVSLLFEAAGYDLVIFETIGVGQVEVDVVRAADTVVVVLTPQSGDAIQALKAGLMEIADIFVVNKADQGGADQAVQALRLTLQSAEAEKAWVPPIVKTAASTGEGLEELKEAIVRHREFLEGGELEERRRMRLRAFVRRLVEEELRKEIWDSRGERLLTEGLEEIAQGRSGPFRLARWLLGALKREREGS